MQFIYLDPEGNPCGPVDESDIVKMIQEGTITRDTAIRNTLLPEFRTVAEIDNFKEALEQAPDAEAYREIPVELGVIERLKLASQPDRAKAESTAYQGKFRVSDATFQHRLYAAIFDCLIFAVVGALLCIPGFSRLRAEGEIAVLPLAEERAEDDPGNADLTFEEDGAAENVARRLVAPGAFRRMDNAIEQHNAELESVMEAATPERDRKLAPEIEHTRVPARPEVKPVPKPAPKPAAQTTAQTEQTQAADPDEVVTEGEMHYVAKSQPKLLGKVLPSRLPHFSFYKTRVLQDGRIQIRLNDREVLRVSRAACNAAFTWPLFWLALFILLYYTFALGIFAQTFGMWFWGIFLTRKDEREVYFLRALAYAALLPVVGILMIPSVLICRRSVADLICGTRQLNVYSSSK